MGKVPAKRKNQQLILYQGERVEFISSLEDTVYLNKTESAWKLYFCLQK